MMTNSYLRMVVVAALVAVLGCPAIINAEIIAQEDFTYDTTAWDYAIPGNYNGGTGWGATWQVVLTQPGHINLHAAIFGTNDYGAYGPQMAYSAGHGGRMYRALSTPLGSLTGSTYFFSANIFTPVTANTHVGVTVGGYALTIEAQADKQGELILWTPTGDNWNAPKGAFTNLYGAWHYVIGRIDFSAGGSVLKAWVDDYTPTDAEPHLELSSTATAFADSNVTIAHWGDSGYSLADDFTLSTVPEPGLLGLLALGGWLVQRRIKAAL